MCCTLASAAQPYDLCAAPARMSNGESFFNSIAGCVRMSPVRAIGGAMRIKCRISTPTLFMRLQGENKHWRRVKTLDI